MKLSDLHEAKRPRRTMGEGWEGQNYAHGKHINQHKLLNLARQAATATGIQPDFLEDAIFVLTRVALDIDHTMFKGIETPKNLIEAMKRFHNKGYWPPTTHHSKLRDLWFKQRYASLFRLAATIADKINDDTVEARLIKMIDLDRTEAENWRNKIRKPIELYKLLQGAGGGQPTASAAKPAEKPAAGRVPRIGENDPVKINQHPDRS